MNSVIVDASLLHKKNGMNVLLRNLLLNMAEVDLPFRLCIVTTKQGMDFVPGRFVNDTTVLPGFPQPIIEQLFIPIYALIKRAHTIFSPYISFPLMCFGKRRVVIVHDAIYLHQSNGKLPFIQKVAKLYRGCFIRRHLTKVDEIITISEYSKNEISKYGKIAMDRIRVIPLGIDKRYYHTSVDKPSIERKYFLHLAALDPRKNSKFAISSFLQFIEKYDDIQLVLVGKIPASLRDIVDNNPMITFLGMVNDDELRNLYNNAKALLYPSRFEGFGLPIIEAFATRCPVITCSNSSIPEIAGDAVIYIDPDNERDFVDAMGRIIDDEIFVNDMIRRGQLLVKKYDWKELTGMYINLLNG